MSKPRRKIDAALKARIALEALGAGDGGGLGGAPRGSPQPDLCPEKAVGGEWALDPGAGIDAVEARERKIGQLTVENPFFSAEVRTISTPDRRAMLDRDHPTPWIRGQRHLLGLARSGMYRPALANDDGDLALMRRIGAPFTAWPFLGSRRMTAMLRAEGLTVNRKGAAVDVNHGDRRPRPSLQSRTTVL